MRDPLQAYIRFYTTLSASTVDDLYELAMPDVHFRDPFNDVRSVELMIAIFKDLFAVAEEPRFVIRDSLGAAPHAMLRWDFTFRPRSKMIRTQELWRIEGMSDVRWNGTGRLIEHIDFWDSGSAFYEHIPLLGSLVRGVRRRLKVDEAAAS